MPDAIQSTSRRLAAILAADIAGYSALVGADEEGTVRALKGHQAAVLPLVGQHGGRVIDTAGDGIMAEFASVLGALKAALAIQAAMAERNADVPTAKRLQYRIGINLGDVIFDETRIYGDGINVAARLEGLAEPGGICVSDKVHSESLGKVECAFEDLGEQALKNMARPVRAYRVQSKLAARTQTEPGMLTLPDKPSIAVLPFESMGGDKEQEVLADGIVEDVLTALSQVSSLFVVARNSSFAFKGKNPDIRDVGRQLGVRYVLEGSVRRSGNRLRVTAQLIEAATGSHIWAEKYDRRLQDIFDIQDELTKEIVTALRIKLTDGEQASMWLRSTTNVEAWTYAMRGEDHLWRGTAEDFKIARSYFERAVALDPSFAKAIAVTGYTHWFESRLNYSPDPLQSLKSLRECASRSIAIDPEEPYALVCTALVNIIDGNFEKAVEDEQKVISRYPSHAFFWQAWARLLDFVNRFEEAEQAIQHAMRLNPLYPVSYQTLLGDILFHWGRTDEARSILQQAIRRQPMHLSSYLSLAALCACVGDNATAKAAVHGILRINPRYRLPWADSYYLSADKSRKAAFLEALRSAGLPE